MCTQTAKTYNKYRTIYCTLQKGALKNNKMKSCAKITIANNA